MARVVRFLPGVTRGSASVILATGTISTVTAVTRAGVVPLRSLAATPESLADNRAWLLATSAVLADRPAVASILGFLVVGLVAVRLCGTRTAWVAAVGGHVLSALIVYAALGLVRLTEPSAFDHVLRLPDYGTSAVIAAWIGAIATGVWTRGRRVPAAALVVASAALGWYFKGSLTVLDIEHAVALAVGIAAVRWSPNLSVSPRLRRLAVNHSSLP